MNAPNVNPETHTATPRARAVAVCVPEAIIARLVGKSAPAPMPASDWPIHITRTRVPVDAPAPGDRKTTASPMASSSAPPMSRRLRPNRSPSTPKVSSKRLTGTKKASLIQVSCDEEGPMSCWSRPTSDAGMASAASARQAASAPATSV